MAHLGGAYWEREVGLFERAGVEPAFVEVVASTHAVGVEGCVVRVGGVELAICRAPDAQYLGALVRSIAGDSR